MTDQRDPDSGYDADYDPYTSVFDDYIIYDDPRSIPVQPSESTEDAPQWTCRRILFVLVTLLVIFAFLAMNYLPGILSAVQQSRNPIPTPTALPRAEAPAPGFVIPYDDYL